jgi:hypothetical protein
MHLFYFFVDSLGWHVMQDKVSPHRSCLEFDKCATNKIMETESRWVIKVAYWNPKPCSIPPNLGHQCVKVNVEKKVHKC